MKSVTPQQITRYTHLFSLTTLSGMRHDDPRVLVTNQDVQSHYGQLTSAIISTKQLLRQLQNQGDYRENPSLKTLQAALEAFPIISDSNWRNPLRWQGLYKSMKDLVPHFFRMQGDFINALTHFISDLTPQQLQQEHTGHFLTNIYFVMLSTEQVLDGYGDYKRFGCLILTDRERVQNQYAIHKIKDKMIRLANPSASLPSFNFRRVFFAPVVPKEKATKLSNPRQAKAEKYLSY